MFCKSLRESRKAKAGSLFSVGGNLAGYFARGGEQTQTSKGIINRKVNTFPACWEILLFPGRPLLCADAEQIRASGV
jgi:hypothetical protein